MRLGLTSQSVRNLVRRGRLRSERTASGLFLVSSDDVENFRSDADEPTWPAVLIRELAWSRLDPTDGAELGGWLQGENLTDRIVVKNVVEEPRAVRSATSIELDLHWMPAGCVGSWHGHPPGANQYASRQDKASWRDTAAVLRQLWLSIIVAEPESRGQVALDWAAYLTNQAGETRMISLVRI